MRQHRKTRLKWFHLGLYTLVLGLISISTQVHAQPQQPCDPQIWDAMKNRAWIEAQREIAQNQNLIFKPDSVLEYTCFDKLAVWVAHNFSANRPFSETDWFKGHPPTFSNDTTDFAIREIVGKATHNYLFLNFRDSYLNTRINQNYSAGMTTYKHTDRPPGITGDINCTEMSAVWEGAKCLDFMNQDEDRFYDFDWYRTNDPREKPGFLNRCTPNRLFDPAIKEAFNQKDQLFVMRATQPFMDGTPYEEDILEMHLDKIEPGRCGHAVPTGITIKRDGFGTYNEMVCTNPGCSYTPGSGCQP